jgi:hypothetical protein
VFTDYLLVKALVLVVLAFLWGIYRGFTAARRREPTDTPPDREQP